MNIDKAVDRIALLWLNWTVGFTLVHSREVSVSTADFWYAKITQVSMRPTTVFIN